MATYRTVFAAKGATIALLVAGVIAIIVGGFLVVTRSALFGVAGAGRGPSRAGQPSPAEAGGLPRSIPPPSRYLARSRTQVNRSPWNPVQLTPWAIRMIR